jgi:hypothetical protein
MKQQRGLGRIATLAGVLAVVVSCSSAVPTDTPGVDRVGQYILREKAPDVDVVLGYKFASMSLGNEWMILEVAVTSPTGETAKIEREKVFLRTPAGSQIPAPTQKVFNESYGGLRSTISAANVARDPMDYFPPNRLQESLRFYVAPGEGVAFDEVTVNDRRAAVGKLFFNIPGGIQPGRWVLGIDLEETEIRIPFELEAK